MKIVYIVTRRSVGYNDENYFWEDGADPDKVFADKHSAQQFIKEQTIKDLFEVNVYELDDLTNCCIFSDYHHNEYNPRLVEILGENPVNKEHLVRPENFTSEQELALLRIFKGYCPYKIVEMEVE